MSQNKLIVDYINKYGSITPDEAIQHCDRCHRLSERVREINEAHILGPGIILKNIGEKNKHNSAKHGKYIKINTNKDFRLQSIREKIETCKDILKGYIESGTALIEQDKIKKQIENYTKLVQKCRM